MEQDSKKPEPSSIKIFQDSVTGNKFKEQSAKDYSRQLAGYLVRECTTICAGRQFDEKWRYKKKTQEMDNDQAKTSNAFDLWNKKSYVLFCAQNCLRKRSAQAMLSSHKKAGSMPVGFGNIAMRVKDESASMFSEHCKNKSKNPKKK